MMSSSMKMYLALLWGISVLVSVSASILETSGINSTAEPDKHMITTHALHSESQTPEKVSVAAPSETVETGEAAVTGRSDSSNDSTSGLVAMGTGVATTVSSSLRLLHASTAVTIAAGPPHPMISETAKPTGDQTHQQAHTTSIGMTAPATPSAASSATVSSLQPASTTKPEVPSELPSTSSPANLTTEAAPVLDPTVRETSNTSTELLSPSPVSVTRTPISTSQLPDSAGSSSTVEPTTISFSTDSPFSHTNVSTTSISTTISPTNVTTSDVSATTVSTTNVSATSVSTTVSTTTISPTNVSTSDVSATNVSTTNTSTINGSTTDFSATNIPTINAATTDASTTNSSTTPAGILIPREHTRLPVPTTKSTSQASKSPPSTEAKPCSTRAVVRHCLIVIASLAVLATVFIISTIILCTKLSSRKYKVKNPQPATEMMCISALLPERNYNYSRQRNPVSNGVLVIHAGADSDEDGGDNLTLSSFLPENDRFV